MSNRSKTAPNTRLGEVSWYCDEFYGTMLFVCQGLLGMGQKPDEKFLDTRGSITDLLEFLSEHEENGMLSFDVFADRDWHTCVLASIETTIPYKEWEENPLDEQLIRNLIEDFKHHVRSLPLCDPDKREGALWTDEDIERGYSEAAANVHQEAWRQIDEVYEKVLAELSKKTDGDEGGSF